MPGELQKEVMTTKAKVLVVEDEQAILKILGIKLRVSGYSVITAHDGEEGLQLLDSARPDVLLLDIILPGMNGLELLEELRSRSRLPVIVFSARPENGQEALRLGADNFLAKPFDVDELVKTIDEVLSRRQ